MHVAQNQLSVNQALPLSRTQEMFHILHNQHCFLCLLAPTSATSRPHVIKSDGNPVPRDGGLSDPVSRANWVYGHVAWLNTLAVEPGWLGAVYQGQ